MLLAHCIRTFPFHISEFQIRILYSDSIDTYVWLYSFRLSDDPGIQNPEIQQDDQDDHVPESQIDRDTYLYEYSTFDSL